MIPYQQPNRKQLVSLTKTTFTCFLSKEKQQQKLQQIAFNLLAGTEISIQILIGFPNIINDGSLLFRAWLA